VEDTLNIHKICYDDFADIIWGNICKFSW